jgi:hypothetical protein
VEWAHQEAVVHLLLASAKLEQGKLDEARRENQITLDRFDKSYGSNKNNVFTRSHLADSLLLLSEIERAQNNLEASTAACRRAYGIMEADGPTTWDFRILDPWVRINYCLKNDQAAAIAAKRLEKIGYKEVAYRRFISTHHERNE